MSSTNLKKNIGIVLLRTLLALFLLPAFTWGYSLFLMYDANRTFQAAASAAIAHSTTLPQARRQAAIAFYASTPASATCYNASPELDEYRRSACPAYSPMWQFALVERTAFFTLLGNIVLLLLMSALGALAFSHPTTQYRSFVFGWRLLMMASATEVIVQGAFAVWLSFWITAHFWHAYYVKLILLMAMLAVLGVYVALAAIFRRVPMRNTVQGELITEAHAPTLWARIRNFAARLQTDPPAQIVAGIDDNFFVTETPLHLGDQVLHGRTLFVSLPLLRRLETDEANAVFAHELGHFRGGDTALSAALGPKLKHYGAFTEQMRKGLTTFVVWHLLHLYRLIFELALQRASREREFAADYAAAVLTSPDAVVRALIKITAYSRYRDRVQDALFGHGQQHTAELGIAQRVEGGLSAFAQSAEFVEAMRAADVPHPFDSHPPLQQRMQNVGFSVAESQLAQVACHTPIAPWTRDIRDVETLEQGQWRRFERDFSMAHDEALAYRYEPRGEQELAHVLRYFPPLAFNLAKNKAVVVSHAGIQLPGLSEVVSWDRVQRIRYSDNAFGDRIVIEHAEKGWLGTKKTKARLRFAKGDRARFKQALNRYWHRHRVMRARG
jgi:Zn-dependent protease with chaperone function